MAQLPLTEICSSTSFLAAPGRRESDFQALRFTSGLNFTFGLFLPSLDQVRGLRAVVGLGNAFFKQFSAVKGAEIDRNKVQTVLQLTFGIPTSPAAAARQAKQRRGSTFSSETDLTEITDSSGGVARSQALSSCRGRARTEGCARLLAVVQCASCVSSRLALALPPL